MASGRYAWSASCVVMLNTTGGTGLRQFSRMAATVGKAVSSPTSTTAPSCRWPVFSWYSALLRMMSPAFSRLAHWLPGVSAPSGP